MSRQPAAAALRAGAAPAPPSGHEPDRAVRTGSTSGAAAASGSASADRSAAQTPTAGAFAARADGAGRVPVSVAGPESSVRLPGAAPDSVDAEGRPSGRCAGRRRVGVLVGVVVAVVLAAVGCGGRATTHHKPGTGHQEATGGSGTLLAAKDERGHRLREVPAAGAPAVRIDPRPDTEGGWNIHLAVERFRFTPESVGGAAIPGRGYARLLVDGKEAGRAYGPWHHIPAGARTVTVRLHADDHTVWAVAGKPVEATVRLGPTNAPAPTPTTAPGRTVEITVTGTSVQPPPSRVEFKKGERLTLRVTSDRADTLHVHGYDRELPLAPGKPASLTLTADRTGLFEVETHGSGLLLTQLVVR
ncbi:hypothetical protein ACFV9D_29130 [Streptomyces sp. NPDC059875]|uniref:hypothetical protein n=1 Tax=unclassified Streptomyces TaxID=2593676 RepID=UPI0036670619